VLVSRKIEITLAALLQFFVQRTQENFTCVTFSTLKLPFLTIGKNKAQQNTKRLNKIIGEPWFQRTRVLSRICPRSPRKHYISQRELRLTVDEVPRLTDRSKLTSDRQGWLCHGGSSLPWRCCCSRCGELANAPEVTGNNNSRGDMLFGGVAQVTSLTQRQ